MKILTLGLMALVVFIVARRKESEDAEALKFLRRQLTIRNLKIKAKIPLNHDDYVARRAATGLD